MPDVSQILETRRERTRRLAKEWLERQTPEYKAARSYQKRAHSKRKYRESSEFRERALRRANRGAEKNKQRMDSIVYQVQDHYGAFCACCGEVDRTFLTVDHVNNDGAEHRKSIGKGGRRLYMWLRRNNYPVGFQLLCFNCNLGKARNKGVCPHKTAFHHILTTGLEPDARY